MNNNYVKDSVFDALFNQAIIDNFYDDLDSFKQETELSVPYTFSPEHEKRMSVLFSGEKRKKRFNTVLTWSKRIAAAFVITLAVLFSGLMFVPEVRATIIDIALEWYEGYVRLPTGSGEGKISQLESAYIPDGFWEDYRNETHEGTTIIYNNKNSNIILFHISLTSSHLSVNTDGVTYETIQNESRMYHVFTAYKSGSRNTVIWEYDGNRYYISSIISIDELLLMAASVN